MDMSGWDIAIALQVMVFHKQDKILVLLQEKIAFSYQRILRFYQDTKKEFCCDLRINSFTDQLHKMSTVTHS